MNTYLITDVRGYEYKITAESAANAKRIVCSIKNVKPSDKWCGVSSLTATKLKI